MSDHLMELPLGASRQARVKRRGHAAQPGSGPDGMTCGDCANYRSVSYHDRSYPKCGLVKHAWTNGPGSDIRKKDPACRFFEAKLPAARSL